MCECEELDGTGAGGAGTPALALVCMIRQQAKLLFRNLVVRPALAAQWQLATSDAHTGTNGNCWGPHKSGQPQGGVVGLRWEARRTTVLLNSKSDCSDTSSLSCQQQKAGNRHLEESKQAKHTLDCSCCMEATDSR